MPALKKGKKGGRKPGRKKKEASVEIESDEYLFDRQEMILCYHGPQIYKAKILKRTISAESDDPIYFVHYHGWNSQWDEWVAPGRCLKYSPENIEKQKEAEKLYKNKNKNKNKNDNKNDNKNNKISNNKKQKKNKRQIIEDSEDSDSEKEEREKREKEKDEILESLKLKKKELKKKDLDDLGLNKKIKIHELKKENKKHSENKKRDRKNNNKQKHKQKETEFEKKEKERIIRRKFKDKLETITIPLTLKDNLVEQYHLIHYDEKLIKLPKPNGLTINNILNDVLIDQNNKYQKKKDDKNTDLTDLNAAKTITEILPIINNGIRGFFKNTLKINLLYNFEKPQFEMLLNSNNNNTDYCNIYGAEHLIRLFYILPNILIHTNGVNETNFGQIKQCISIILQFLAKNKAKYLKDYNLNQNIQNVDEKYIAKTKQIAKKYDNKM